MARTPTDPEQTSRGTPGWRNIPPHRAFTAYLGTAVGFAVALGRLGSVVGPLAAAALISGGMGATQVLLVLLPVVAVAAIASVSAARLEPAVEQAVGQAIGE